ncbi:MAG: 1-deoxy-D-xylulose-5-phosphate reductoisomerase [Oscillospiraceae bacterium]|nr:1-deoxy-D-xylulose-5-phosphate reductoisomerase [Oscillospiraceae bacterium]
MAEINISILGSTGSVGSSSLEVIETLRENGGDYEIFALCANKNIVLLENQIRKFKPEFCVVCEKWAADELKIKTGDTKTKVLEGMDGINFIASHPKTDYVINALMGQIGLKPTLTAIKSKKNIGLANKEPLVAAGDIVMAEAKKHKVDILPIDSEHNAIYQCLIGEQKNEIDKLTLTASGGPFYGRSKEQLKDVKIEEALRHPTWKMGKKITIDSATMMNKGLELVEACHLFCVPPDDIEILIHRESIIHSLVQFKDKSVKCLMSLPDIKMCAHYALTYANGGKRELSSCKELDLTKIKTLNFEKPDDATFVFLDLARHCIKQKGTLPAAMNAANEAAVDLFLDGRIAFLDIFELVQKAVEKHKNIKNPDIEAIIATADEQKREITDIFGG